MNFVWTIIIVVAFTAAYVVAMKILLRFLYARNLSRYDNYDRTLSSQDQTYIEHAVIDLETAANVKNPKWYRIFLCTAFLPTMFICWGVIAAVFFGFDLLINLFSKPAEGVIFQTGGHLAWAFLLGVFGGIFLAGAALYAVSMGQTRLSNFIALNSNMHGFDKVAVWNGLLSRIEHKIRSREQITSSKFSADVFLKQVNQSYRDGCLKWFYGCMFIAFILGFFDLRSETALYPDRVVSSGTYFSLGPKQGIAYKDITDIELDCYFSDSKPSAHYILFQNNKFIASIDLEDKSLDALTVVNSAMRAQTNTRFRARQNQSGKQFMDSNCVENLGEELGDIEMVRKILVVET